MTGRSTPFNSGVINTPHEVMFQQALIRAGIGFETQFQPLPGREVDIKILQAEAIVEIGGRQRRFKNDEYDKRVAELKEAGYKVARYLNDQVEDDADSCVHELIQAFGLQL
jgi:very-short-patch-repair endonuclease